MSTEQERAEFEAWAQNSFEMYRHSSGEYSSNFTQTAWAAWQAGRAALQSQDREDAERYRWLREHGFNHADVELTSDLDGNPITIWRLRFYIPEPSGLPYEEDEWTLEQLDEAIDHARRTEV